MNFQNVSPWAICGWWLGGQSTPNMPWFHFLSRGLCSSFWQMVTNFVTTFSSSVGFAFGGGRQPHSRGWICPHPETILGRVRPIYSQWVCDKLESLTNVGRLCFSSNPSFQVQRIFWGLCQKLIIWLVCYPDSWNPRKHTDNDCITESF